MASDFLTLFTDASFCARTSSAGWGAWAIRDDWERSDVFGASIPIPITSVNDAETYAIASALVILDKRDDTKGITNFSIQADNVHALGVLLALCPSARLSRKAETKAHIAAIQKPTELQREAARLINRVVGTRLIFLKHVKGHQQGGGRSWVNGKCDELAGKYMREARRANEKRIAIT